MPNHPPESCARCTATIASSDPVWYGSDHDTYCTLFCMREAKAQGVIPDYVEELFAPGHVKPLWRPDYEPTGSRVLDHMQRDRAELRSEGYGR